MQTNREDVGDRYLEIEVPLVPDRARADEVSALFRNYFLTLATERKNLIKYLKTNNAHHFFVSGAELPLDVEDAEAAIDVRLEEVIG